MLTYLLWSEFIIFNELSEYLEATLFSIFTIPLDILMFPLELIALIIYLIRRNK